MAETTNHIPEAWVSKIGGRDTSGWLGAFANSPQKAVADLLWDAFYFGPLNLTDRRQLLTTWLDLIGNSDLFAELLDQELTVWVNQNWGRFGRSAEALASAWSCLCNVVEFSAKLHDESTLKNCAAALKDRFAERHQFLGSFSTAPSADPLGNHLAVVAEFQGSDRRLAPFWHNLCELPDGIPFYHARYGILGLRRIKAADPSDDGTLRAEVVSGLLRLAQSFDRLVRERKLQPRLAADTFRLIARQTAAAYPSSPGWAKHGVAGALELPEHVQGWFAAIPSLATAIERERRRIQKTGQYRPRKSIQPDPSWMRRVTELAERLRKGERACLPEVQKILDEQRQYAEITGETYNIVRTLCQFASRVLPSSPERALAWASEARRWEPRNDYTWNTLRTVLLYRPKWRAEALRVAWVAWKRFPADVVAQTGLAEALRKIRRYPEAEFVYRLTIERFPTNIVARNGLANLLVIMRRRAEAEAEYRRSIELGYQDAVTYTALASLIHIKGKSSHTEVLDLLNQSLALDPINRHSRLLKRKLETGGPITIDEFVEWNEKVNDPFAPSIKVEEWDVETADAETPFTATEQESGSQARAKVDSFDASEDEPSEQSLHRRDDPISRHSSVSKVLSEEEAIEVMPSEEERTEKTTSAAQFSRARNEILTPPEKESTESLEANQPRGLSAEHVLSEGELKDSLADKKTVEPAEQAQGEVPTFKLSKTFVIAALVAEANFYRTWAKSADRQSASARRRKAFDLLSQAERLSPQDSQVIAEKAALSLDEGNKSVASEKLRAQLSTHPGGISLLLLKARLDRQNAQEQGRRMTEGSLVELCLFPQKLREQDASLGPLFHYQKGLAAIALCDGDERKQIVAASFSSFRQKLAYIAAAERAERKVSLNLHEREVPRFHEWVQTQVDNRVFVGLSAPDAVNIDDIATLEKTWHERLFAIHEVEDYFVDRLAFGIF